MQLLRLKLLSRSEAYPSCAITWCWAASCSDARLVCSAHMDPFHATIEELPPRASRMSRAIALDVA
jgi:hypothetical protein